MTVASVQTFFSDKSIHKEILLFEDISTVSKAAESLGVTPGEIAKSLLFQIQEGYIVIVMAGDKRLDNRKYKDLFKTKAKMPDPASVLEATGHPAGGVCPFGLPSNVTIYLDQSLLAYATVYPAAGAPNAAVEMTVSELAALTDGIWIDVAQSNSIESDGQTG